MENAEKIFLGGIAAAGSAAYVRSEYEKRHFVTDRQIIRSPKIRRERNLVFLSDLHENVYPSGHPGEPDRLCRAIGAVSPDAVLIGGDMIIRRPGRPCRCRRTVGLLAQLVRLCPVYYANGNHEDRLDQSIFPDGSFCDPFLREISRLGVVYLRDRSVNLFPDVRLSACTVPERLYRCHFRIPVMEDDYLEKRLGPSSGSRYQILLLHSPQFFRNAAGWGADLTLSGHFHGGTIRIPGLGGLMTPQYQFFRPECAGRFDRDGKTMIVSRGLGTHSINIRLNNRPELLWITLLPEQEKKGRPAGEENTRLGGDEDTIRHGDFV